MKIQMDARISNRRSLNLVRVLWRNLCGKLGRNCLEIVPPLSDGWWSSSHAVPDTGCTGTVLNVAAAAAAAGRKVLVVDGDFRRPGLAEQLGLPDGGNGLGDVLGGSGGLSSVAVRTEAGFDLVGQVQKPPELLIDLVPQVWMSCWMTRGGNGI